MILGNSVSNHHCRDLITPKSSGIHYLIFKYNRQRTYMYVRSFIDAACSSKLFILYCCLLVHTCSSKFVLDCCVLLHIASVVTQHSTITRMVKNQPR